MYHTRHLWGQFAGLFVTLRMCIVPVAEVQAMLRLIGSLVLVAEHA